METLKNALLAPFSDEAAGKTTPAKSAVVYACVGLLAGVLLK